MTTDSSSTVRDQTIGGAICGVLWAFIYLIIQIITYAGALLQVVFFSMLIGAIIIGAICIAYIKYSITRYLDDFTGFSISSQINRDVKPLLLFLFVLVLVLLTSYPLCVSVQLYKGLEKNREDYIWGYIISGVVILGIRVWAIDSYEYHNFPEDKTVLYCALYALYLLLLVINCFGIRKAKRAELAEIATATTFFAAMQSNDGTTTMLYASETRA